MNNYRNKRQDDFSSRGNRDRASFNPNFGSDNRLKSRSPRYGKDSDERPLFDRAERGGNRYKQGGRPFRDFDNNRAGGDNAPKGRFGGGFKPRFNSEARQDGVARATPHSVRTGAVMQETMVPTSVAHMVADLQERLSMTPMQNIATRSVWRIRRPLLTPMHQYV